MEVVKIVRPKLGQYDVIGPNEQILTSCPSVTDATDWCSAHGYRDVSYIITPRYLDGSEVKP